MSDAPTTPSPTVAASPDSPAGAGAQLARTAATCRACAAPLAADQRYCLNCGARVAAPRVEWDAAAGGVTGGAAAGAGAGASPPRERSPGRFALLLERVGGPMGAAAVVLVALGVGFLLGQGGGSDGGPATVIQRPPVINVQGGGTAAPTDGAGALDAGADATTSGRGGRRGAAGGSGSTKGVAPATPDSAGGDLGRLQQQPTEQATQGAPPRADRRPSGGGTEAETIG